MHSKSIHTEMQLDKNPPCGRLKSQNGFTMIEMVMVIVMVAIMGVFTIQYLFSFTKAATDVSARKDLLDETRLAMEFLTREMRLAVDDVTLTCAAGVIAFNKTTAYPVDADITNITYSLNGSNLERVSTTATTTLASNVTAFTVGPDPSDANLCNIVITATNGDAGTFTLTSSVRPRDTI